MPRWRHAVVLLGSVTLVLSACGRHEPEPERRITSSSNDLETVGTSGVANTGLPRANDSAASKPMTSGSAPTPKDVCDRFAELMRKAGKGGRKIEKKARRCRDRLPSLRNEQPTEFECVTSCAMAADTLAAFDACDERCGSPSNDTADAH